MFKVYLKIAWRNIARNKVYTIINVAGLALGVCACLVIFLVTQFEFSFDRFHPDGGRIYRIVAEMRNGQGEKNLATSVPTDLAGFQQAIPGFEAKVGYHKFWEGISIPGKPGEAPRKFEGRIEGSDLPASILTGPEYFSIFKYHWLAGNPSALASPFKVVLTETAARKYFGTGSLENMLGKTVIYADSLQVSVAGIVADWNEHTDLGYNNFISISTGPRSFLKQQIPTEDWTSLHLHGSQVFVKLATGVTTEQVNQAFAAYITTHVKFSHADTKLSAWLQPISDIHFANDLHDKDDGDSFRKPYKPSLYALIGLALFILVIATVNFINLSTAQSIQRAKEVGIRKVMGSRRSGLILQFLTETLVLTLMAVLLAVALVTPALRLFGDYIPAAVRLQVTNPGTLLFLFLTTATTTLLAGFYPARVLSSHLPALSLKGEHYQQQGGHISLRKALIVFQFTISLVFIIGALVIGDQIRYMRDSDKGFSTDAVLTLNNWGDHTGKTGLFAEAIKKIPGVKAAILQSNAPMGFAHMQQNFTYKGKTVIDLQASINTAGADFVPFYQMRMLAGRNMSAGDSVREVVINETCSRSLGFMHPQDAPGKFIYDQTRAYAISGVVADFFENSFRETMKPVIIIHWPEFEKSVAVKLDPQNVRTGNTKPTLLAMEREWKSIFPNSPFDYSFLNESITWLYGQENKTAWLVNAATGITIFISCMGLFGLCMFTAKRKTKEIGIRKVLGASVFNITTLLTRDFVRLVIIALFIATPIAWYFVSQWLQGFVYRVSLNGWTFLLAGFIAVAVALLTISFKAIAAATANPATSLRTE